MKWNSFILFIVCTFVIQIGIAQNFQFPNKNGVWYVESFSPGGKFVGKEFVEKDTVINSLNYLIITDNGEDYQCALRSDSIKTYAINLGIQPHKEFVLYDWSLKVGDKWKVVPTNFIKVDTIEFEVVGVDSVFIIDSYRIRLELYARLNHQFWIEGIGSTISPAYHYFLTEFEESYSLLCYRENDEIIYNNGCKPLGIPTLENIDWIYFSISDKCIFTKHIEESVQIKLYNCAGHYIENFAIGAFDCLDLSFLERGHYIVSWQKARKVQSFKIIIN